MNEYGAETTADEVLADVDLSGKTILLTGGYSGIGREAARAMAAKGAHVIIAGRDADKLASESEALAHETGAAIDTLQVDLASLDSVRRAGEDARRRFDSIDILVNNAGVMACPKATTQDGFERQFGTNHVGHFALTSELWPLLENGRNRRIVNLSSRAHHIAPVDLDDIHFEHRDYDKWVSYGQSKTANVLFTVGLQDRFGGAGFTAYAVHPGGIMTNLGRHLSQDDSAELMARIQKAAESEGSTAPLLKTVPQGAATTCFAATADLEEGAVYCEDAHVAEVEDRSAMRGVRSYAVDRDAADRLWARSEELIGGTFPRPST